MASPLLPFTGGLRQQAPYIVSAFSKALARVQACVPILVDPFLGGGSVSYAAKQQGICVHSADLARRSFFLGRALIANERPLGPEVVNRLAEPHQDEHDFVGEAAVAGIDTTYLHLARRAWHNAVTDTERYLAQRVMLDLVPQGGFGPFKTSETSSAAVEGREKAKRTAEGFVRALDRRRRDINAGITWTGFCHTHALSGAYEQISRGESLGANCVHLDPPTYGNENYLAHYTWQDWFVGDTDIAERAHAGGAITKKNAADFLSECVRRAAYAPVVIVTMQEVAYRRNVAAGILTSHGRTVSGYKLQSGTSNPFWMIVGILKEAAG